MASNSENNLAEVEVLESRGPALLLSARGRINALNADGFEVNALDAAAGTESYVVIEASGVTYVSSAGLRAFLRISRVLEKTRRSLYICGLKPYIQQVFVIAGFDRVIPLHDDVDSALTAAQQSNG